MVEDCCFLKALYPFKIFKIDFFLIFFSYKMFLLQ